MVAGRGDAGRPAPGHRPAGGLAGRVGTSQAERAGGFIAGPGCRWGGTNRRLEKARCRAGEAGPVGVVGQQAWREPGRSGGSCARGRHSAGRARAGPVRYRCGRRTRRAGVAPAWCAGRVAKMVFRRSRTRVLRRAGSCEPGAGTSDGRGALSKRSAQGVGMRRGRRRRAAAGAKRSLEQPGAAQRQPCSNTISHYFKCINCLFCRHVVKSSGCTGCGKRFR